VVSLLCIHLMLKMRYLLSPVSSVGDHSSFGDHPPVNVSPVNVCWYELVSVLVDSDDASSIQK